MHCKATLGLAVRFNLYPFKWRWYLSYANVCALKLLVEQRKKPVIMNRISYQSQNQQINKLERKFSSLKGPIEDYNPDSDELDVLKDAICIPSILPCKLIH